MNLFLVGLLILGVAHSQPQKRPEMAHEAQARPLPSADSVAYMKRSLGPVRADEAFRKLQPGW